MPTQIITRGPVQRREFSPEPAAQGAAHRDLIDHVRVHERGPEVLVEAFARGIRLGHLQVPYQAEHEMVCRLFGEVPALRVDREAFTAILHELVDTAVKVAVEQADTEPHRMAHRRAMAVYDTMARDIASLSGLPEQGRGAA